MGAIFDLQRRIQITVWLLGGQNLATSFALVLTKKIQLCMWLLVWKEQCLWTVKQYTPDTCAQSPQTSLFEDHLVVSWWRCMHFNQTTTTFSLRYGLWMQVLHHCMQAGCQYANAKTTGNHSDVSDVPILQHQILQVSCQLQNQMFRAPFQSSL